MFYATPLRSILVLLSFAALTIKSSNAFQVLPPISSSVSSSTTMRTSSTPLYMSEISPEQGDINAIGETERMLIEAKRCRDLGLTQRVGKTVKGDHLDGVRAFVWGLYHVANYVFVALAVVMTASFALAAGGYAFHFEEGRLIIQTIEELQKDQFLSSQAAKLMADASEHIGSTLL